MVPTKFARGNLLNLSGRKDYNGYPVSIRVPGTGPPILTPRVLGVGSIGLSTPPEVGSSRGPRGTIRLTKISLHGLHPEFENHS